MTSQKTAKENNRNKTGVKSGYLSHTAVLNVVLVLKSEGRYFKVRNVMWKQNVFDINLLYNSPESQKETITRRGWATVLKG